MSNVSLSNLCKSYDNGLLISNNINLEIGAGEFVVFVGPSGCGKSTLLRCIAGLEEITSGDLFIGGKRMNDVEPSKRGVGMVFQSYALYPHLNLADNMSFGLKLAKASKKLITERVNKTAEMLQLTELLARKPKELSGGQRQRVAIGRTLVSEPEVFLLDEPLSNLDAALRVNMRIELSKLHERLGCTMIYVTHDQIEAMTLADKIVVLDGGFVAQVGAPLEIYHYPENKFVAGFIGSPKMNFIDVYIQAIADTGVGVEVLFLDGTTLWLPIDQSSVTAGSKMTLGIRPEHLLSAENGDVTIEGQVLVVEKLGSETQVYIELDGSHENWVYSAPGTLSIKNDDHLKIGIPAVRCHLFHEDGKACRRQHVETVK